MKLMFLILGFIVTACSSPKKVEQGPTLRIVELAPNKDSHITTQNLVHLTKIYDLDPIIFFKTVHIKEGVNPTHKPVILLNTRFVRDPDKLLAAFIHEQFHWWLVKNPKKTNAILKKIRKAFPNTRDHIHLLVCFLEYRAMIHFRGKKIANQIMHELINREKILPWFYKQAQLNEKYFEKTFRTYQLMPAAIN